MSLGPVHNRQSCVGGLATKHAMLFGHRAHHDKMIASNKDVAGAVQTCQAKLQRDLPAALPVPISTPLPVALYLARMALCC